MFIKESEKIIVDALFRGQDQLPLIISSLKPDDFTESALRKVFTATSSIFKDGKPIDPLAVSRLAGVSVDDFPWTGDCFFNGMSIDYHIEQLKKHGQRRRLQRCLREAVQAAQDESKDISDIQQSISNNLYKTLAETNQTQDRDIAEEVLQFYVKRKQQRKDGKLYGGISTGISKIDNATGGLLDGSLNILGGRSGHGKSTVALDVFFRAGKAGVPCLYISLEQTAVEVFLHLLQKYTAIKPLDIKLGMVSPQQETYLRDSILSLKKFPCFYEDKVSKLSDIIIKIKSLVLSKTVKLIVIDYLQLIENPVKGEARHIEVAGISRVLKRLAIELNVAILGLSQLNKDNEQRHNKKIYLSDLRESEAIGHDADMVMFLNRPELYADDADDFIEIAKNRHGERVAKIALRWDAKYNSYYEL